MPDDDAMLAGFLDTLLPGDDLFPAGVASGMLATLRDRLRQGDDLLARLLATLIACGWSHPMPSADARRAVIAAIEADAPQTFFDVRKVAYLTYYEQPSVIAAIRHLGFTYNTTPLPDGYPAEAFDALADRPRHGRGGWVATADVARVDLAALPHLAGAGR